MNLLETVAIPDKERVRVLLDGPSGRIEQIVSCGQFSEEYDQEEDEWILLLQGNAKLWVEGEEIALKTGDSYFLKRHVKHRVLYTSQEPPCIWLCVFGDYAR